MKDYEVTKGYEAAGAQAPQEQCNFTSAQLGDPQEYRLNRLKDRIRYHAPGIEQVRRYQNLRDGALAFATVIVRNAPDNRDCNEALNLLEMVLMIANKSIALEHNPF